MVYWIFGALHTCCAAALVQCNFCELYIYCNISLMHCIFGALHHWCYVFTLLVCYALTSLVCWIVGALVAQCCHYKKVSFGCPHLMGIKSLGNASKNAKFWVFGTAQRLSMIQHTKMCLSTWWLKNVRWCPTKLDFGAFWAIFYQNWDFVILVNFCLMHLWCYASLVKWFFGALHP